MNNLQLSTAKKMLKQYAPAVQIRVYRYINEERLEITCLGCDRRDIVMADDLEDHQILDELCAAASKHRECVATSRTAADVILEERARRGLPPLSLQPASALLPKPKRAVSLED